jgi:hypothetical protein
LAQPPEIQPMPGPTTWEQLFLKPKRQYEAH